MSPAAGPLSPSDIAPAIVSLPSGTGALSPAQKDEVIDWYRGEFAAANAIIDALCHHLATRSAGVDDVDKSHLPVEYESAFAAIHRRRLNWIPVLQMQKYFTISDVAIELRKAASARISDLGLKLEELETDHINCIANGNGNGTEGEDSPDSEITDTGSHEIHTALDHTEICENHEECADRREQIKMTKGFVAKESVRGHMVNVVKGLKMFEDIFTDTELSKLNDFVHELRTAGQNGELSGETYMLFNKHMKANKREQIQLGVPLFGKIKEVMGQEQKANIEDIPAFLQNVIDHLVQWHILPENRKPNGCIINYFDEGEFSQPYLKPPHMDQPVCTLVLSESTMAFGRALLNDGEGNYKGHLMLSVKHGSVLVMRNHSADMARHAMCTSSTRRVSITFSRVRPDSLHNHRHHHLPPLAHSTTTQAMSMWHPMEIPSPPRNDVVPNWGMFQAPVVMLSPMIMNPRSSIPQGGTGVFLPWASGSRKPAKQLPPRAQKSRYLATRASETHICDTMSDPGVRGEGCEAICEK